MSRQTANHVMMIAPAGFCANPQTLDSNAFQQSDDGTAIADQARAEAGHMREMLIDKGIMVTGANGHPDCPDALFCNNWVSTHANGVMNLYPMEMPNRRAERQPELIAFLQRLYPEQHDYSAAEKEGKALEGTGSLVLDRVNRVAYAAISSRTDPGLVTEWCAAMDYEPVLFPSADRDGAPVYHTNVIMFIGTGVAGLCADAIADQIMRQTVIDRLRQTHEVVLLEMAQMYRFCGNMLELENRDGQKLLALSETAHQALQPAQKAQLQNHCDELLVIPIPVIEKYGGGSVRCMLLELF